MYFAYILPITQPLFFIMVKYIENKMCYFNHFKVYNSVTLIIFTVLCNYHHVLQNILITSNRNSSNNTQFLATPTPSNF